MQVASCRVAVTGGAGFIGSHLVDRLLAADNHVVVIDDFSTGSMSNLAHHSDDRRLEIVKANVCDAECMRDVLRGEDVVFHLATRNVRLSLIQPTVVHEVNATGTLNVLKAAAANGVRRFLYCSSSEVNGTARVVPLPEKYHFQPETIYGASKLTGEYYTQVFHRSGWLQTIIARPHNNYGPREHYAGLNGEVIPRFILWALAGKPLVVYGDGSQTRDFTFVTETADYLVKLVQCDAALGGTFNVCRGQEATIAEVAQTILKQTGSGSEIQHLPGRPSDVLRLFGDATLLRNTLGSSPQIGLSEGLAETVAWFRKHVQIDSDTLKSLQVNTWDHYDPEPWLKGNWRKRIAV